MRQQLCGIIVVVSLGAGLCGCRHGAAKAADSTTTQPTTKPQLTDGVRFDDKNHGFTLLHPTEWTRRKDDDPQNVLTIDRTAGKLQGAEIDVSVPKLPPHIPDLIPLMAVEKGYVKDVRKRLKNVNETDSQSVKIDGASARRFVLTGEDNNGPRKLLVLAIVNGDHLYVVTLDSPADEFPTAQPAFDLIARTWKWK